MKLIVQKNSIKQTIASVIAAFVGIQSNKNRQRDFTEGKFSHFVIVGVIAIILFIVALITFVSWVVPS
jgi:hypothetical protein